MNWARSTRRRALRATGLGLLLAVAVWLMTWRGSNDPPESPGEGRHVTSGPRLDPQLSGRRGGEDGERDPVGAPMDPELSAVLSEMLMLSTESSASKLQGAIAALARLVCERADRVVHVRNRLVAWDGGGDGWAAVAAVLALGRCAEEGVLRVLASLFDDRGISSDLRRMIPVALAQRRVPELRQRLGTALYVGATLLDGPIDERIVIDKLMDWLASVDLNVRDNHSVVAHLLLALGPSSAAYPEVASALFEYMRVHPEWTLQVLTAMGPAAGDPRVTWVFIGVLEVERASDDAVMVAVRSALRDQGSAALDAVMRTGLGASVGVARRIAAIRGVSGESFRAPDRLEVAERLVMELVELARLPRRSLVGDGPHSMREGAARSEVSGSWHEELWPVAQSMYITLGPSSPTIRSAVGVIARDWLGAVEAGGVVTVMRALTGVGSVRGADWFPELLDAMRVHPVDRGVVLVAVAEHIAKTDASVDTRWSQVFAVRRLAERLPGEESAAVLSTIDGLDMR